MFFFYNKISIDKGEAKVASSTENKKRSDSVHKLHRKNSGRDSANHSPSDVMLASPSLSSMSDNHSEVSLCIKLSLPIKDARQEQIT